jgi:hypothetical protein
MQRCRDASLVHVLGDRKLYFPKLRRAYVHLYICDILDNDSMHMWIEFEMMAWKSRGWGTVTKGRLQFGYRGAC